MRVDQVVPPGLGLGLGPEHLKGELAYLAGQVRLVQLLKGPATTLRTVTPGASSASGGVSRQTARVKTSTSIPRAASLLATSTT